MQAIFSKHFYECLTQKWINRRAQTIYLAIKNILSRKDIILRIKAIKRWRKVI